MKFERIRDLMVPLLFLSTPVPEECWLANPRHPVTTAVISLGLDYMAAHFAGVGLLIVVALSSPDLTWLTERCQSCRDLSTHDYRCSVFIMRGQVDWGFAVVLAFGFAAGGWIVQVAVRGGEDHQTSTHRCSGGTCWTKSDFINLYALACDRDL